MPSFRKVAGSMLSLVQLKQDRTNHEEEGSPENH